MKEIKRGVYQNYKGDYYQVIGLGKSCGGDEKPKDLVIYKALYEREFPFGQLWVREADKFFAPKVNAQGKEVPRMTLIKAEE